MSAGRARRLGSLVGGVLFVVVGLILAASLGTAFVATYLYPNVIYSAWRGPEIPPAGAPARFQHVVFSDAHGARLAGWYGEGRGRRAGATIIVCHGWSADKRDLRGVAEALQDSGYDVLSFDLHGWGESDRGAVTFGDREAADILGAVHFVKELRPGSEDGIGLIGFSMGAAAAIRAATQTSDIDAVVADASYARLDVQAGRFFRRLAGPAWPFVFAAARWFEERLTGTAIETISPVDAIAAIAPRPVLIIHGTRDRVIDVDDARRLYQAAGAPKSLWLIAGAGHGQTRRIAPAQWDARVAGFFRDSIRRGVSRDQESGVPAPHP